MAAKIEAKGKQVKAAAGVKGQGGREARGKEPVPLPGELFRHSREAAYREMARRLRFEAILLDIAAAAEADRASELAAWGRAVKKYRHR